MTFDMKKANEAANEMAAVSGLLGDAGLATLSTAAQDLMDRIEAVIEGDSPIAGDEE
mgnify:CR=1 FL=1